MAIVNRQIEHAIDEINKAISIDPSRPIYYNLLSYTLSSHDSEQALSLALAGWKECINYVVKEQKVASETAINWEQVFFGYRINLMKLVICLILVFV